MRPKLLLPSYFRVIGFFLTAAGLTLWYLFIFQNREIPFLRYQNNVLYRGAGTYTDEVYITSCVIGMILIGFSKLKHESEETYSLRLNALYSSILIDFLFAPICLLAGILMDRSKEPVIGELSIFCVNLFFYHPFILLLIFVTMYAYLVYWKKADGAVKTLHFLPNKPYNFIGKGVVVLFILLVIASVLQLFKANTDMFTIAGIIVLPFFLLWLWSKEKIDNESITSTRLKAMQIALYINYGLFLIGTWVSYSFNYIAVIFWGFISLPITFLLIFYLLLYRTSRIKQHNSLVG
ncbi:MAG TPA: hypothetical protein VHB54_11230 [Mucilaginibacter sp.]|nr:hypothetical protein [Mucilaginibacter sp.]